MRSATQSRVRWACYLALVLLGIPPGCRAGQGDPSADVGTAAATDTDAGTGTTSTASDSDGTSTCDPRTPAGLGGCVDAGRVVADLSFFSAPRPPGSPHWQAVQDRCADGFAEAGLEVERFDYGTGVNVIGLLRGATLSAEFVMLGAHYDSTNACDGADDNASGTVGVIGAARALSLAQYERSLVFVCWDEEEWGTLDGVDQSLVGSEHHARRIEDRGEDISVVFSFEMIAYTDTRAGSQSVPEGFDVLFPEQAAVLEANEYRGDFLGVVTDTRARPHADAIIDAAAGVGLPAFTMPLDDQQKRDPQFIALRTSDHDNFWRRDIPAVMITDTGTLRHPGYHCRDGIDDDFAALDTDFAVRVIRATTTAAAHAAQLR